MVRRKHRRRVDKMEMCFWSDAAKWLGEACVVVVSSAWFYVWTRARRSKRLLLRSGTFHARERLAQIAELRAVLRGRMKRRTGAAEKGAKLPHAEYSDLLESLPTFAAWMTDSTFEDGTPRQGGWFSVYCRAGTWTFTLNDSAEGLTITLTAPTWTQALSLVEHCLLDPDAPWRPYSPPKGKFGKK